MLNAVTFSSHAHEPTTLLGVVFYNGIWLVIGVVVGSLRDLKDVLARKHAEQERLTRELGATVDRLRHAQDMALMGWWTHDVTSDTMSWSPEIKRLYGLGASDPTPCLEVFQGSFVAEADHGVFHAHRVELLESATSEAEFRVRRTDGREIWVYSRARCSTLENGNVLTSGIVQGITDRKEKEAALRRTE